MNLFYPPTRCFFSFSCYVIFFPSEFPLFAIRGLAKKMKLLTFILVALGVVADAQLVMPPAYAQPLYEMPPAYAYDYYYYDYDYSAKPSPLLGLVVLDALEHSSVVSPPVMPVGGGKGGGKGRRGR